MTVLGAADANRENAGDAVRGVMPQGMETTGYLHGEKRGEQAGRQLRHRLPAYRKKRWAGKPYNCPWTNSRCAG